MLRSLFMTLIALLAAACVQVGSAPSGSPVVPSASDIPPSSAGIPSVPAISAAPTTAPGTTEPTRTRRPRPQRTDRPTQPPTQLPTAPPSEPPTEPPTAPPTEPPTEPLADLVIEQFTAPQCVTYGQPIEMSFIIRNIAEVASGDFVYAFDGPREAGFVSRVSLGPGSILSEARTFTAPDEVVAVTVSVQVDHDDDVTESDETNNVASQRVQVVFFSADCDLFPGPP